MSYKILQKSSSSRLNQGNDTAYEYAEIGTSRRGAAATAAATEQMDEPGPQPKRGPGGEGSDCELQRQPRGLEDGPQRFPSSAAPGHCAKRRCLGPPSVFSDPGCGPRDSVELFGPFHGVAQVKSFRNGGGSAYRAVGLGSGRGAGGRGVGGRGALTPLKGAGRGEGASRDYLSPDSSSLQSLWKAAVPGARSSYRIQEPRLSRARSSLDELHAVASLSDAPGVSDAWDSRIHSWILSLTLADIS